MTTVIIEKVRKYVMNILVLISPTWISGSVTLENETFLAAGFVRVRNLGFGKGV